MTKSADPRLTRVNPVKETINLNERIDLPLYKQAESYNNYKERVGVSLEGVKHADKILHNKSDYTQRGE